MFIVEPNFYDDFKCIASKCKDSCCIGWEIDVDEDSLKKYNNLNSLLGEKIRSEIIKSSDGSYCFKLGENERCPFLDKENLCEIIKWQDDSFLCDICREHPRFYNESIGAIEKGLGLCCEEVCRLLLEGESIFELKTKGDKTGISLKTSEDEEESREYIFAFNVRGQIFDVLKNNDLNFENKLLKISEYSKEIFGEKVVAAPDEIIVEKYLKTEPINEAWVNFINEIADNLPKIKEREDEFDKANPYKNRYARILAYIIYRHFVNGIFDGAYIERLVFSVEAVRFIKLSDIKTYIEKGEFAFFNAVENLKNWSKQIEYSYENTDFLMD